MDEGRHRRENYGGVAMNSFARAVPEMLAGKFTPRELLERYFEFEGDPDVSFYRGAGCKECGETGFRGRIGVHELAVPNQEVRGLLIDGAPLTSIGQAARRAGFRPLIYDGLKKVLRGLTSIEEVAGLARD